MAHPLAVGVVGLGQVDGDEPVLVSRGDLVEAAGEQVEAQPVRRLGERDEGKAQVEQLGDQSALGRLGLGEPLVGFGIGVRRVGCGSGHSCGRACRSRRRARPSCIRPRRRSHTRPSRRGRTILVRRPPPSRTSRARTRAPSRTRGSGRSRRTHGHGRSGSGASAWVISSRVPSFETQLSRPSAKMFASANHPRSSHSRVRRLEPDHRTTNRTTATHHDRSRRFALARVRRAPVGTRCSDRRFPVPGCAGSWGTSTELGRRAGRPPGGGRAGHRLDGHLVHRVLREGQHRPGLALRRHPPGHRLRRSGSKVTEGLIQRLRALNLFIGDLYGDAKVLADGIVPGRDRRRLPELPARVHRDRRRRSASGPTSAAATSSATPTACSGCWRTTCGCRPACPTCWRTARSPSGSSPSCSAASTSSRSTATRPGSRRCWRRSPPAGRRAGHRRAHPGHLQLGLLRARLPGPADGRPAGRGQRPGRRRRRRVPCARSAAWCGST